MTSIVDPRSHASEHAKLGTPELYLEKLQDELSSSHLGSPTLDELLEQVRTIWRCEERQLVLERLEQMGSVVDRVGHTTQWVLYPEWRQKPLPDGDWQRLAEALRELVSEADALVAGDRHRADQSISRLLRLVPIESAWSIIKQWFWDPRPFRRRVAVRILFDHGVPENLAAEVVDRWKVTGNSRLFDLIGRNPHVAALIEEHEVLNLLAEPVREWRIGDFVFVDHDALYRKMRAIELLLAGGKVPSDALAMSYPMAFAWAVGKRRFRPALPTLRRVLDARSTDPEFVWRCMRAFDRMGEPADIDRIRKIAASLVSSQRETIAA